MSLSLASAASVAPLAVAVLLSMMTKFSAGQDRQERRVLARQLDTTVAASGVSIDLTLAMKNEGGPLRFFEPLEAPLHVRGGQRVAAVERDRWIQLEGVGHSVRRIPRGGGIRHERGEIAAVERHERVIGGLEDDAIDVLIGDVGSQRPSDPIDVPMIRVVARLPVGPAALGCGRGAGTRRGTDWCRGRRLGRGAADARTGAESPVLLLPSGRESRAWPAAAGHREWKHSSDSSPSGRVGSPRQRAPRSHHGIVRGGRAGQNAKIRRGLATRIVWMSVSETPSSRSSGTKLRNRWSYP